MADTIDYVLDRSGRYIPAVVSGTYSLIDKLITSVAAVIATGAVAILGYTTTMPQPTDAYTSGIFWMTLAIKYGLPMLGWLITLMAMLGCPLTKEEMVNVQSASQIRKRPCHEVIRRTHAVTTPTKTEGLIRFFSVLLYYLLTYFLR